MSKISNAAVSGNVKRAVTINGEKVNQEGQLAFTKEGVQVKFPVRVATSWQDAIDLCNGDEEKAINCFNTQFVVKAQAATRELVANTAVQKVEDGTYADIATYLASDEAKELVSHSMITYVYETKVRKTSEADKARNKMIASLKAAGLPQESIDVILANYDNSLEAKSAESEEVSDAVAIAE